MPKRENVQKAETVSAFILCLLKPCVISSIHLVNWDHFFFHLFHSDSLVFSALSYAEWFSPLVTKSKTYISVHCLLLLQEKPPARVSFTSVFEERWSAELLLWRQHVLFFFTQQNSHLFLEITSKSASRPVRLIWNFVFKVRSRLKTLSYLTESCFDLAEYYLRELPHF